MNIKEPPSEDLNTGTVKVGADLPAATRRTCALASPRRPHSHPAPRGPTAALALFKCVCIYGVSVEGSGQIMSRWHVNTCTYANPTTPPPHPIHLDSSAGEEKTVGYKKEKKVSDIKVVSSMA